MMRTIILDGYNIILRSPAFQPDERRDLEAARTKLENLLSWAVGGQGEAKIILVFDGADVPGRAKRKTSSGGRVDVRYSSPPQKADDLIRVLVEEAADNEREVTVVTSDLELAQSVRGEGVSIVFSDLFAASLFEDKAVLARATAGGGKAKGGGPPPSPTAQGSDAETKPGGMSKKQAAEWLRLFEEREADEDPH
jgi:predicted RNA-binding protein with PIN domain